MAVVWLTILSITASMELRRFNRLQGVWVIKLKHYCVLVLMGLVWPTGAITRGVNINLTNVDELFQNFNGMRLVFASTILNYRRYYGNPGLLDGLGKIPGFGLKTIKENRTVIVVKVFPLQTQINVTSD